MVWQSNGGISGKSAGSESENNQAISSAGVAKWRGGHVTLSGGGVEENMYRAEKRNGGVIE